VSSPVPSPEVNPAAKRGPGAVYEFCGFRLDCGRFELLRNSRPLRVERKPMELLILLASREGQLVTRPEIAERLWSSEVFVDTEHGINTAIRKLRHLLHDNPDDPQFIQTVTGRGYRFVAPTSVIAPALPPESIPEPAVVAPPRPRRRLVGWYVGTGVCVVLALGGMELYRSWNRPPEVRYTQVTDFTDSAVAPALSPDGRSVAFIRGGHPFLSSDRIYMKMLPNGESRRVTEDDRPKYGLAFSSDGSEIAYTVLEDAGFSTYEVSVLGGEPHLLERNQFWLMRLSA
jgi:DNA-binding winged helix-turn-helix (wHTH) protein